MEYVKYDPKQRKELQKNLERLRVEHGLSKQQLADKLGWSRNTIDYWIRGDRVPDRTGIEAICDYFGISDVELLGSEMKVRTARSLIIKTIRCSRLARWKRSRNKRAERSSRCGACFATQNDSTRQLKHT